LATLLVHHPVFAEHLVPSGHPERPDRIRVVNETLSEYPFDALLRREAPLAPFEAVLSAHKAPYAELIRNNVPESGFVRIDADTYMSPRSFEAALHGVGAAQLAVDEVLAGRASNAFCAVRPPGHHAESDRAMGFCLFNNAVIAACHAQSAYGAERVAIVDFDVHHGNGTQEIVWSDPTILYASTHQMPLYPGTGAREETGVGNIFNAPLPSGADGATFRDALAGRILPAVDAFAPDLIVVSAGFDAHRNDPLAGLQLVEEDFAFVTGELMRLAARHCDGRLVSVLEGGYDLEALARSVSAHVGTLMSA